MRRLEQAIRQGLQSCAPEARRLLHGRGHTLPGLEHINIDCFDSLLLVTLYRALPESHLGELIALLRSLQGRLDAAFIQRRYCDGAPIEALYQCAEPPYYALEMAAQGSGALEGRLRYLLSFSDKQNIGYFLDMSPGRDWLAKQASGRRVLNLFSYTCSLSVAAIAGGAEAVVNVDMSRAALNAGRENHRANGQQAQLKEQVYFLGHNIFKSWAKIKRLGPYDIVIIDPPSHQLGSFIAEKDYPRVIQRLPQLMPRGGQVLACLNAPELGEQFLQDLFAEHCPLARYKERLANRADFPELDMQRSLKMLVYSMPVAVG